MNERPPTAKTAAISPKTPDQFWSVRSKICPKMQAEEFIFSKNDCILNSSCETKSQAFEERKFLTIMNGDIKDDKLPYL